MTIPSHLQLCSSDWLGESEEWQSEIDEAILVLFDVGLSVNDLFIAAECIGASGICQLAKGLRMIQSEICQG